MKIIKSTLFVASLLCVGALAAQPLLSSYKVVMSQPPANVPTPKAPDGAVAGNGDIGISMGGTPDKIRLYIGKNDFWNSYPSYPQAGIALPGGIDIDIKELKGASYRAEMRPDRGDIDCRFATQDIDVGVRAWVAATANMIVLELNANRSCRAKLKLWTPDDLGAIRGRGVDGSVCWVTRSLSKSPLLEWPCQVAMALGKESQSDHIEIVPGTTTTVAIVVYTNFDRDNFKEAAIAQAKSLTAQRISLLAVEHQRWWDSFWRESWVEIDDQQLMHYYYISQYIFASTSRQGKFAPGIWGCFVTGDRTAWGGDYHLNYNYQAPYWASYSSNHIGLTDNFDQPLLDYMAAGREHARSLLGVNGIYYPVGVGPRGYCPTRWPLTPDEMERRYASRDNMIDGGYKFLGQKINAVFSVANMLMRFYSTYDKDYAERIYPYMLGCADFWEEYLVFENGRYVIKEDHFNEVMPNLRNGGEWRPYWGDFNSTLSLGLVNMLFKGMLEVSDYIGKDAARATKWNHILSHMSQYATGMNADGRVALKSMEVGSMARPAEPRGLNRVSIHGLIMPAGVCGPVTDSEFNKILLNDVSRWSSYKSVDGGWGNTLGNGIETIFPGAVRVGYDSEIILRELHERIRAQVMPNMWITQAGGGIETLAAVPLTINEMLMQSYEGVVRLFPNWSRKRNASFTDLRAYGAFLVSSSLKEGEIRSVVIKSEMGRTCTLENPWGNGGVRITSNMGRSESISGDRLEVRTMPNEVLTINRL